MQFAKLERCVYGPYSPDYADANVFMRPFEIYRAALYNVYGGSRVTDVPYIIIGASLSEPHIDEMNARNPYIIIIIIMFIYVWYVRHARTAIDIVQRCAVYFKRPHENICVSIDTCFLTLFQ